MAALSCVACNTKEGTFRVEFDWGELTPPATGTADVFGTVIGQGSRFEANSGAAVPYAPGASLTFSDIPYDDSLVVEVRIVAAGAGGSATPQFFGRSVPFNFEVGEDVVVPVQIVVGPSFEVGTSTGGLSVLNAKNDRVPTPELQLQLQAVGADTIQIAQDAAVTLGVQTFDAAAAMVSTDPDTGLVTYNLTYDLNATREDCAPDRNGDFPATCEGIRQVVARLTGGGFESPVVQTLITLDTVDPEVATAAVLYVGGANNPLVRVTRATDGTAVVVTTNFTETIDVATLTPTLSATNGTSEIMFALETPADTEIASATFVAEISAALHTEGIYVPTLQMEDLAGNVNTTATFVDPSIVVDLDPEGIVVDQSKVSYIRSPFGNADAESLTETGSVVYTIPAGVAFYEVGPPDGLDAVDRLPADTFQLSNAEAPSQIRFWSEFEQENLLGSATPNEAGEWLREDLTLLPVDNPRVFVTGLDEAGNESAPVLIQNAWFVGSTAQNITATSPHSVETTRQLPGPLSQGIDVLGLDTLRAPDGNAEVVEAQRVWRALDTTVTPGSRVSMEVAYDSGRDRIVLFGGFPGTGITNETWEWDGFQWTNVTPEFGSPPGRDLHSMAYDSRRGRVVLFGGQSSGAPVPLRDTWEWDGTQWTEFTGGDLPPAVTDAALAFDSARGKVVMFGGLTGLTGDGATNDETWEFDGVRWQSVETPAAGTPQGRQNHRMAYDAARGQIILIGGIDEVGFSFPETWAFDGSAWSIVDDAAASPAQRVRPGLAYDPRSQQVVLFGGGSGGSDQNDTWVWNGTAWSSVASNGPAARVGAGLVYDPLRERLVLVGGDRRAIDTWAWEQTPWTPTGAAAPALSRRRHQMIYDSARQRTVLFGGQSDSATSVSDTYEWNGSTWTRITTGSPPGRRDFAMAYDTDRSRIVLFSGNTVPDRTADTWERVGTTWVNVTPASNNPAGRDRHAMAYDAANQQTILMGGEISTVEQNDTWAWNGTTWTDVTPANVPNELTRSDHAMAYDPVRQRIVLFGGNRSTRLADTWEWDGSTWTEVTPTSGNPPARREHRMVYDSTRRQIVMFGGDSESGFLNDAWAWDGTSWTDITADTLNPSSRERFGMAYDSDRDRIVIQGGNGGDGSLSDTWELNPPETPTAELALRLPSDVSEDALLSIRVRAGCGGTFAPFGATDTGAHLYGWVSGGQVGTERKIAGAWEVLGSTSAGAPLSSPEAGFIDYQPSAVETASVATSFVTAEQMFFHCRPAGESSSANGAGVASVALDYLEVRLKYDATP